MKNMKAQHLAVKVKNIEKSVEFYKDILGLEIIRETYTDDGIRVVFFPGLEMHQKNKEELKTSDASFGNNFFHFGIEVESIEKVLEALKAKKDFPKAEYMEFECKDIKQIAKCAFFSDPDEMSVEIVEWVKM